jgi:hypothetical protein
MNKPNTKLGAMVFALNISILSVSLSYAPAHAVMMTIEPDDYAVGTNVSNLLEGATMTRFGSNIASFNQTTREVVLRDPAHPFVHSFPVYVEEVNRSDFRAATGTQSLGNFGLSSPGFPVHAWCWFGTGPCTAYNVYDDPFYALVIHFDSPTNYVEIAASAPSDIRLPLFELYGSNGQPLSTPLEGGGSGTRGTDDLGGLWQITRFGSLEATPTIQTVFVGGFSTMTNVDRISYNSVPEPSSLLLLGIGLAGAAAWRRGQRH